MAIVRREVAASKGEGGISICLVVPARFGGLGSVAVDIIL